MPDKEYLDDDHYMQIWNDHQKMIKRRIDKAYINEDEREDLSQDIFLRFWKYRVSVDKADKRAHYLNTLISSVIRDSIKAKVRADIPVKHEISDYTKTHNYKEEPITILDLVEAPDIEQPEKYAIDIEIRSKLCALIKEFVDVDRKARFIRGKGFYLVYLKGYNTDEAAKELNQKTVNIRRWNREVRQYVRDNWHRVYDGDT